MIAETPIEEWPDRLEAALKAGGNSRHRVFVVRETDSTQEAARRIGASANDVVVAWRQTAGRGRLGRRWFDPENLGIAATFVRTAAAPEYLAVASAVGTAWAAEKLLDGPVGIKWPNDIMVDGRKLAGILIQQTSDLAFIGIGMNVNQIRWPATLADRAVSLAQISRPVDRLEALGILLPALFRSLFQARDVLEEEFARRDCLRGSRATFLTGQEIVTGRVLRTDPGRGLLLSTDAGEVFLPAATTTMCRAADVETRGTAPVTPVAKTSH